MGSLPPILAVSTYTEQKWSQTCLRYVRTQTFPRMEVALTVQKPQTVELVVAGIYGWAKLLYSPYPWGLAQCVHMF